MKLQGRIAFAARLAFAVLGPAIAFGCAGANSGSSIPAVAQKVGAPAPGMSRVVVYPTRYADASPIQLDGVLIGEIKPGAFMLRDVRAGQHELVAESATFPAISRHAFTTAAGRTYYFRVSESEYARARHEKRSSAGTLQILGEKSPGQYALHKFTAMTESSAASELAEMTLLSN